MFTAHLLKALNMFIAFHHSSKKIQKGISMEMSNRIQLTLSSFHRKPLLLFWKTKFVNFIIWKEVVKFILFDIKLYAFCMCVRPSAYQRRFLLYTFIRCDRNMHAYNIHKLFWGITLVDQPFCGCSLRITNSSWIKTDDTKP